jgi:uncharacterized protein
LADATEENQEWFEPGLSFECTQCGNCCTGPPGYVWFTDEEAKAMAAFMKMDENAFRDHFATVLAGQWSLKELKRDGQYDCVFLDRDKEGKALCSIYSARPKQCRTWPFWSENLTSEKEWRLAKQICPGMNSGNFFPADQVRLVRDKDMEHDEARVFLEKNK